MKCQASDNHPSGVGGICAGEMEEKGNVLAFGFNPESYRDDQRVVTLYQCKVCKDIKIC